VYFQIEITGTTKNRIDSGESSIISHFSGKTKSLFEVFNRLAGKIAKL